VYCIIRINKKPKKNKKNREEERKGEELKLIECVSGWRLTFSGAGDNASLEETSPDILQKIILRLN
jgi:hypothetical protein